MLIMPATIHRTYLFNLQENGLSEGAISFQTSSQVWRKILCYCIIQLFFESEFIMWIIILWNNRGIINDAQ